MATQLNEHDNTKKSEDETIHKKCNYRNKNDCPLNGHCLQSAVIYQVCVKCNGNDTCATYVGLTGKELNTRYRKHTASFQNSSKKKTTEISKYF